MLGATAGVEVRYGHRVVGVARAGRDRLVAFGRDEAPFTVHVEAAEGHDVLTAAAVIDASGTWGTPTRWAPTATRPRRGRARRPDLLRHPGPHRPAVAARYAGKHVAVAGRGASAQNALVALDRPRRGGTRAPG